MYNEKSMRTLVEEFVECRLDLNGRSEAKEEAMFRSLMTLVAAALYATITIQPAAASEWESGEIVPFVNSLFCDTTAQIRRIVKSEDFIREISSINKEAGSPACFVFDTTFVRYVGKVADEPTFFGGKYEFHEVKVLGAVIEGKNFLWEEPPTKYFFADADGHTI